MAGEVDLGQLFITALLENLRRPSVDAFGNPLMSTFDLAFSRWWSSQHDKVVEELIPLIDFDEVAEKIATKIHTLLVEKPGWFTYDSEKMREMLNEAIKDKLAQKIVDQMNTAAIQREHVVAHVDHQRENQE
jgi:hypothetical protein